MTTTQTAKPCMTQGDLAEFSLRLRRTLNTAITAAVLSAASDAALDRQATESLRTLLADGDGSRVTHFAHTTAMQILQAALGDTNAPIILLDGGKEAAR